VTPGISRVLTELLEAISVPNNAQYCIDAMTSRRARPSILDVVGEWVEVAVCGTALALASIADMGWVIDVIFGDCVVCGYEMS
jgi:hypothetical protein